MSDALIPSEQILRGGPPRDGIPSIDNPGFEQVSAYKGSKSEEVLTVTYNGVTKAYPVGIMDWHEIVNDKFAGRPVVVTYCPLCGSGVAFDAKINGATTEFGVSGLLYNSDVLLYDRATESLWSQIMAEAVTGPMKGESLTIIPTQRMDIKSLKSLHSDALILSSNTGYARNYQLSPYAGYSSQNRTYFPISNQDDRLHKKTWVIGITVGKVSKAFPLTAFPSKKSGQLKDQIGDTSITISWDPGPVNLKAITAAGKEIPALQMYWFAWAAFHPETLLWVKE